MAVWHDEESQRCPDCNTYAWEWDEGEEVWEPDVYDCKGCARGAEMWEHKTTDHKPEMIRGWKLRFFRRGVSNGD